MTVKIVRMVKRRSDLTPAQFKDYWLERHAPLERRAVEAGVLRKVVATFATGEVAAGGKESPFDGMVALYCDDADQARALFSRPEMASLREDAKNFADVSRIPVDIVAEETLVCEKPEATRLVKAQGQLKIVRTVYRRRDLTQAQFKDYWLKNHARLEENVVATTPMQRIVATFALPQAATPPDVDGIAELYFGGVDDIRQVFAGSVPAMMRKDEENFVQMDAPAIRAVCEEYLIA
jgi:uncharacterized protein (TIGR02118 family)